MCKYGQKNKNKLLLLYSHITSLEEKCTYCILKYILLSPPLLNHREHSLYFLVTLRLWSFAIHNLPEGGDGKIGPVCITSDHTWGYMKERSLFNMHLHIKVILNANYLLFQRGIIFLCHSGQIARKCNR